MVENKEELEKEIKALEEELVDLEKRFNCLPLAIPDDRVYDDCREWVGRLLAHARDKLALLKEKAGHFPPSGHNVDFEW